MSTAIPQIEPTVIVRTGDLEPPDEITNDFQIQQPQAVDPDANVGTPTIVPSRAALARLGSNFEFLAATNAEISGSRGQYKLTDTELGRGGMGAVYLATDPDGKKVAVKTISPHGDIGRFGSEISKMRELAWPGHPNLMAYVDDGNVNGTPFLVVEYIEGKTLDKLIASKEISIGNALCAVAEVCKGLGYLHRKGIVHRDIKPSNIMVIPTQIINTQVVPHPAAKLIDVTGLAKRAFDSRHNDAFTRHTQTNTAAGTLQFMAPEQAKSETTKDCLFSATDIWQIGCLIAAIFMGDSPFVGMNGSQQMDKTRTYLNITNPDIVPGWLGDVPFLNFSVPPHIANVVSMALRRDPAERGLDADGIAGVIFNTLGVVGKDLSRVNNEALREQFRLSQQNAKQLFKTPCPNIPHMGLRTGSFLRDVSKA